MSSTKPEWKETQDIALEEYFDLRFKEAIKTTKKFIEKLGEEQVYEILDERSHSEGIDDGKAIMKNKKPLTSLSDFSKMYKEILNDPLFKTALETEIIEDSPNCYKLNVKKCLWAHTFNKNNAPDIGYHMICNGDYGMAIGFSPNLRLQRTQTLMQGAPHCDFKYTWEEP